MASPYPGPHQVGSYFVGQYYQVLQQHPDFVHQFYADASSMMRVDGETTDSASTMLQIHNLVTSLNFTSIEIKTINSLDSWNGGVLVMVTGSVKTKDFGGKRKFAQTFFLAPQEKGYFVMNDIFQFVDDDTIYQQHATPVPSENIYQQHQSSMSAEDVYHQNQATMPLEDTLDAHLNVSSSIPEPPVSNYSLEEEAADYVNSVHIEDESVDRYCMSEEQQQQDYETEIAVQETPVEETPASFQGAANAVQDTHAASVEKPVEEPAKKTYASILRVLKESSSGSNQPTFNKSAVNRSAPTTSDGSYKPALIAQQSDSTSSFVPESGIEAAEEGFGADEGEPKSVYVRNLPSDVTSEEIEEEFKHFGTIIPDGVFIRNRKDVPGVCYAFVEFEDLASVQNAIRASPIQLAGRQVYIEERRPNSGIASRGGRGRGRGRGGYPTDSARGRSGGRTLGRGSNQDGGDYNRARGNGYYQRASR